jgi:ubiquinone/menaquinone biosynthesis C-methylase UbiE
MTGRRLISWTGFLAISLLPFVAGAQAGDEKKEKGFNPTWVPTPQSVVEKMFEMAKVNKKDVLFDLGCGDGIILCMAAKKYGIKAVGMDLNPTRIKEAHDMVNKFGVEHLVWIRQCNALKVKDFDRATVVTLYMLPEFLNLLEPIAKKTLKPGTRIVSHDYKWDDDRGWLPDVTVEFESTEKDTKRTHTLYMWTVKAPKREKSEK